MHRSTHWLSVFVVIAALVAGLWLGSSAHAARPLTAPRQAPASPPVVPQAWLPSMNYVGTDDVCRTWVAVQNVGQKPSRALLLTWKDDSDCGEGCSPVVGVECSGLILPGSTWHFLGAQIATNSASGTVFSFADLRKSDPALGLGTVDDDLAVDALCDALYHARECTSYAAFKLAADTGGSFAGLPLGTLAGSPLAVTVLRHCPGDMSPGVEVSASYNGVSSDGTGSVFQPTLNGYVSYLAPVTTVASPGATYVYAQNAGAACAAVEVWFRAGGETCAADQLCRTVSLAPGTSARVSAFECVGRGWQGTVWVKSEQPVALLVDHSTLDTMSSVTGAGGVPSRDAAGRPALDAPGTVAFAPLVYDRRDGWETRITIQNLDHAQPGRARVSFRDAAGAVLQTSEVSLCPHGSQEVVLARTGTGTGTTPGSARVESLPVGGALAPVPVSAVTFATHKVEQVTESGAYELLPDRLALPGAGKPGVAVLALPMFVKNLDGVGIASELAVQNLVDVDGFTDFAVLLYDANDLVATFCGRLAAQEVSYIELWRQPTVSSGFLGNALVSATSWQHPDSASGANLVGLGAVLVQRSGTVRGQELPGDELMMATAAPLTQSPVRAAALPGECPVPPPPPLPASHSGEQPADGVLYLPVLTFQGQDDVCETVLEVENTSRALMKLVLVAYGEPGFCSPICVGPNVVACSGLLAPGAKWIFGSGEPLAANMSGVVYGFNDRTMADVGLPGGEVLVADWICANGGLELECSTARQLHLAYLTGGRFAGIPMGQVIANPVAGSVQRECPDVEVPGLSVASSYAGQSGAHFAPNRGVSGGYWQSAAVVLADVAGASSIFYVQNAGLSCATVTATFRPLDECAGGRICTIFTLAPGEAYPFDSTDCIGPDFAGTLYLHSTQPLAVAVDTIAPSVMRSWSSFPSWSPYDLDNDGDVDEADFDRFNLALGSTPQTGNWNPRADLDHDLAVNWSDRVLFERGGLCRAAPTTTPTPTVSVTPTETPMTPGTPTATDTPSAEPQLPTATSTPRPVVGVIYLPFSEKPRR